MFSQTAEYALRAAICLVQHQGEGPLPVQRIAEQTRVPPDYLSKVLQQLNRSGIVNGRRGINGGYSLARPARELSILDVLNAVDPIKRIESCPLGLPEHATRLCSLHRKLDDALAQIERTFAAARLDKMAERGISDTEDSSPLGKLSAKKT